MDFIDEINSETLIIYDGNIKDIIIDMHILKPLKFMTMHEFLHKYFFDYDEKAIIYITSKYNVRYEIAQEYLENIYYIENKQYNNSKLDFLVNLKNELDNNNLLIYNDRFKEYLNNIKILLYDIDLDEYLQNIFNSYNYQQIERKYHKHKHIIYEFDDMEREVQYVANSICQLIDTGINPQMIKITNIDESYYNTLERIFNLYNLKINISYKTKLASYPQVQEFLNEYKKNNNIALAIEKLTDKSLIYNELIKVINRYQKYHNDNLLIYKIENSIIKSLKYDKGIDIVDYVHYIANDNEYIFMLNFNEGSVPRNEMDNKYISDNLCNQVGLKTTREINQNNRAKTIKNIQDIKNLVITYKLKDDKRIYYKSNLTEEFEITKIKNNIDYTYSEIYDQISLVKQYDEYIKYGYKNPQFDIMNNNYKINYNSYNNKYHKIDRIVDKLTLSYTKMQLYNKCAFRYYLSDVLKMDIFEENFSTTIGSMVHYVMEKCLNSNDSDTEKYAAEFLKDKTFSKKELFFLKKYKMALKELLNQVLLEREYSIFNNALYEKKIDIDYGHNIHFIGIIDKILYYIDDDTTYITLIDYKTGNDDISLKYIKYGLNIQLPIYLYLSTKMGFNNVKYPGFYLQKFNLIDKDYRLIGYSNSNPDTLTVIDKDYSHSKIIKGLKTNKDGSFAKSSKVLTDQQIEEIKTMAEKSINAVIKKITANEFPINPKVSDEVNLGCEYCKFNDICFKKIEDEMPIYGEELGGNN